MGKLRSLQVVRFLAALGVVWEHAVGHSAAPRFTGGQAGIDLFFVLSGFVISHAAKGRPESFMRDRLVRIYPTYWLWAAGWLALAAVDWSIGGWPLFTTLTLFPAPTDNPLATYVGVGWTLSFEMLFYTAVWLTLKGVSWWLLALAWSGAAIAAVLTRLPLLEYFGSPMVVEFLLGILAYRLGRGKPLAGAIALVVSVVMFAALPRQAILTQAALGSRVDIRVAFMGPLAFMVVWGAAQFDCKARWWGLLVLLGDASYSLYLSHSLLLNAAARAGARDLDPFLSAIVCTAFALAAYLLVERPMLSWLRRPGVRPTLSPKAAE